MERNYCFSWSCQFPTNSSQVHIYTYPFSGFTEGNEWRLWEDSADSLWHSVIISHMSELCEKQLQIHYMVMLTTHFGTTQSPLVGLWKLFNLNIYIKKCNYALCECYCQFTMCSYNLAFCLSGNSSVYINYMATVYISIIVINRFVNCGNILHCDEHIGFFSMWQYVRTVS